MRDEMKVPPFLLSVDQRQAVEQAIREVCKTRGYGLLAVNVRTNHVHSVISAQANPERIEDALKAYSTRRLREFSLINSDSKVWPKSPISLETASCGCRDRLRALWAGGHSV